MIRLLVLVLGSVGTLALLLAGLAALSEAERANDRLDQVEKGLKRVERVAYRVPEVVDPADEHEGGGDPWVGRDEADEAHERPRQGVSPAHVPRCMSAFPSHGADGAPRLPHGGGNERNPIWRGVPMSYENERPARADKRGAVVA